MRTIKALSISVLLVSLFFGGSMAYAGEIQVTHSGSLAKTTGNRIYVASKNINHNGFTSVNYRLATGTEGSLVNRSGKNTTATKRAGKTSMIRSCVSRTALPMSCSGWRGI